MLYANKMSRYIKITNMLYAFLQLPCNTHAASSALVHDNSASRTFCDIFQINCYFIAVHCLKGTVEEVWHTITLYATPPAFSILSSTCNTCWSIKSLYHFIKTAHTLSLKPISSNRLCPNQELRTPHLADTVYKGVILPNRYVKS